MPTRDFERLYDEHAKELLGFLAYRTGDRFAAEDILADTFERVLRTRRGFDRRRGSEKTWLYSIALNCLRDRHRRRCAETRALDRAVAADSRGGPGDDDHAALHERDALQQALSELRDEEQLVVTLRFGGDLSMPEIAKVTGERLTTVEGRLYRGLGRLRIALEDGEGESEQRPAAHRAQRPTLRTSG